MTADLRIQREYAQLLTDILEDFLEIAEDDHGDLFIDIRAEMVLDALGLCGLVLQPGEDAGMAFIDGLAQEVKRKKSHN